MGLFNRTHAGLFVPQESWLIIKPIHIMAGVRRVEEECQMLSSRLTHEDRVSLSLARF